MAASTPPELSVLLATNPAYPAITICALSNPPDDHVMNDYIRRLAEASANATLDDQLNILFQNEKPGFLPSNPTRADLLAAMTTAAFNRLHVKAKQTASAAELVASDPSPSIKTVFVIECASFAAVACWTPPSLTSAVPPMSSADLHALAAQGKPIFAHFMTGIENARQRHLYPVAPKRRLPTNSANGNHQYGYAFWYLSLMARDPRRGDKVKGAVRGTLQPVIEKANQDGVPLWLEAGNDRARDVYAYFGCEVVEEVVVEGVSTWCMIKLPQKMRGNY